MTSLGHMFLLSERDFMLSECIIIQTARYGSCGFSVMKSCWCWYPGRLRRSLRREFVDWNSFRLHNPHINSPWSLDVINISEEGGCVSEFLADWVQRAKLSSVYWKILRYSKQTCIRTPRIELSSRFSICNARVQRSLYLECVSAQKLIYKILNSRGMPWYAMMVPLHQNCLLAELCATTINDIRPQKTL